MNTWSIADITSELKTHQTWRKQFFWWPTERWVLQDPTLNAFCREAARLSQSVGVSIHPTAGVDTGQIDATIAAIKGLPSWVQWCVTGTPYGYVAGADNPYDMTSNAHNQDVNIYIMGLVKVLDYIITQQSKHGMNNKVGMIFLDTEQAPLMPNGDPTHDAAAKKKLDFIYNKTKQMCKAVLGYEVKIAWYGQYSMNLNGEWRQSSPIPNQTLGDVPNTSLYGLEDPHLTSDVYNRSLENAQAAGKKEMIPVFCLAGGYFREFHYWVNTTYEQVKYAEYPRNYSWLAGRNMQWSPWYSNTETGKYQSAPYGIFWPGMLPTNGVDINGQKKSVVWKYWPLHFLAFSLGCNNIKSIPEGEAIDYIIGG